ncbi:ExeA family protein, partial [Thalassolituus sp. UBA6592]
MYLEYFGFDRFPFTIAPDPDFLFPSAGHQEALAHLQYALTGLGGLICLTGEVGTGKTTLCRSFLAGLDDSVRTAYIFNPQLSPA